MKILRIRIGNYRGVDAREVKLTPIGITVIQGPNEIGKSSLVEAVRILFDHLDSSSKKEVLSLKPVHKDVGAEIEVDIESGPYVFTYLKRFHKKTETNLHISRPKSESLTGREAHERVAAILAETMDVDLWKALSAQQGMGVEQADLGSQRSLSAALDRVAGGAQGGVKEETLYDKVREEHALYFTERGEKKVIADAELAVSDLQKNTVAIEADLKAIEKDIDRSSILAAEIVRLTQAQTVQAEASKKHEARWRRISAQQSEFENQEAILGKVTAEHGIAGKDVQERARLRKVLEETEAQRQLFLDAIAAIAPELGRAQDSKNSASLALIEARKAHERIEQLARLRKDDYEWRRNELDLVLLEERKKRIDQAISQASEAQEMLDKTLITDSLLKKIRDAHMAVQVARGQLEAGSPLLRIEALADIAAKIDGKTVKLKAGENRELPVSEKLKILISEIVRIEASPGRGSSELAKALQTAEDALTGLLKKAAVRSLTEAEQVNNQRLEAKRHCATKDEVVREALRDLTVEDMGRRIAVLRDRTKRYSKEREHEPTPAKTHEKAQELMKETETTLADATAILKRAEKTDEQTSTYLDGLLGRSQEAKAKCEVIEASRAAHEQALAKARSQVSDEDLVTQQEHSLQKVQHLQAKVEEARRLLSAEAPDQARHLSEHSLAVLATTAKELRRNQDELIAVGTRLEQEGERGLWEQFHAAKLKLDHAGQEIGRLRARASAAKLLFEIMAAERENARARYFAPLRDRIQRLGRFVFGESFAVDLGEDLSVSSCTREGRTVPFKDLSVGAQEQLGLLSRLSCALLVSKEGGPLILDDALGYADPKRLEAMGAVLAIAGRETQVIVLTCMPERYRHVGEATLIHLDGIEDTRNAGN